MFVNGLGKQGSISGWVIPKTQKMVLDASLLNTQHYRVWVKGKVEQSWERSSALPYTLVYIEKEAVGSPSTMVANFTFYFFLSGGLYYIRNKNWNIYCLEYVNKKFSCWNNFFWIFLKIIDGTFLCRGCPHGVMVKVMDCRIVVRKFVLQSRYYVHFRANTLGKGMNPLILPAMLNSTTTVLLGEWLWH